MRSFRLCSGKSTVSRLLIETNSERQSTITKTRAARNHRNDRIIDTDAIGHQILLSSAHLRNELGSNGTGTHERYDVSAYDSVYDAILETFGDTSVSNKNILNEDAQIDRRKLGEIIFRDPSKRKMLNRITHPRIIRVLLQQLITGTLFGNGSIVCADVPLLFETGSLRMLFCLTIVVACDPDVQYTRLRKRNADLSEQQCRDRIASQMPMNRKVKYADIVIWNNGTQEDLSQEVERARTEVEKRLYSRITLLHFVVIFGILQCIQNMWKLYYKSLSF